MKKCLNILSLFLLMLMSMSPESYGIAEQDPALIKKSQSIDQLIQKLSPQEREFLLSQRKMLKQVIASLPTDMDYKSCKSQKIIQNESAHPHNYGNGFFVFVSLSMTENNIIQLAHEAKRYGAILVLRGLKNGNFRETVSALKTIIEKSQNGLIIDPTLFKHYNVIQVPSFILASNERVHDRVVGNISISYALTLMAQEGDHKEKAAQLLKGKENT